MEVFSVRLKRMWVFDTVFKSTALKKKKKKKRNTDVKRIIMDGRFY